MLENSAHKLGSSIAIGERAKSPEALSSKDSCASSPGDDWEMAAVVRRVHEFVLGVVCATCFPFELGAI